MKEINFSNYFLKHNLYLIDIKLNNNKDSKISLTNIKKIYLYSYLWTVITNDFYLFKDFERVYSSLTHQNHILERQDDLKNKLQLTKEIKGSYFLLGGENNYWHLLIDYLPRLICLKEINLNNTFILINEDILDKFQLFILKILDQMNLKNVKFIKINRINRLYKFENLFIPSRPSINFAYDFYDKIIGKFIDKKPLKNLYIKRGNVSNRKVINEIEVEKLLSKYNYEIIDCAKLSVDDQIKKFSSAKNIIIVHGASLANLLFAPDNINVVEIRSNINGEFSTKLNINDKFNLFLFDKTEKLGKNLRKDIIVNINELEKLIVKNNIF